MPAIESIERERAQQRLALGAQIRSLRQAKDVTQTDLGVLLGAAQRDGEPIPQTTISRWEKGMVDLTASQIRDLERALEIRYGTLLAAAGFIDANPADGSPIADLLISDPTLDSEFREDAVRSYRSYQRASSLARNSARVSSGRRESRATTAKK